jgi:hypothetical protein
MTVAAARDRFWRRASAAEQKRASRRRLRRFCERSPRFGIPTSTSGNTDAANSRQHAPAINTMSVVSLVFSAERLSGHIFLP